MYLRIVFFSFIQDYKYRPICIFCTTICFLDYVRPTSLKSKIIVIGFKKIGQILGAAILHCSYSNPIRPRALSSYFFVRTRNRHFTFRWHVTCRPNQVRRLVYTGDIYIRSWDLYKPNQATLHPASTRDKVKTPCSVIH